MVKGQELKILFADDLAFLTQEVALNFTQVKMSDQPIRFKSEAYWTVRVINYIANEKRLHVEILKYHVGNTDFSYEQTQLKDQLSEVETVTFKNIDTSGLLRTLNGTSPQTFSPPKPERIYWSETPPYPTAPSFERKPLVQTYQQPFSIPIKDVTFQDGSVSFEKKISPFKKPVAFQIDNAHLVKEYDAIKNYFATVLQTKKIEVTPSIIITDGEITSINATSGQIDKIDKSFIEEVKFELFKATRRKEPVEDNLLFEVDEYIETFTEEGIVTTVFNDEQDFIDVILERSGTKHYYQLRFLSSKQLAAIQKLRVIHRPFSFVFFLTGAQQYHIVWETLDTQEATYIWSMAKDDKGVTGFVKRTDAIIQCILKQGKNEYLRQQDIYFTRVFHDYTNLQNGFKAWKEEIELIIHQ